MFLTIFDLVLILIVFIFISFGFVLGLLQAIGSLVGLVLGTWIAGLYYAPFAQWLEPMLLGNSATASIVSFIIIFTVVNRLVGLLFWFVYKAFNLVSIIPFTKTLNRILGATLGLVEGVLGIGIVLYFISQVPLVGTFGGVIENSQVAQLFIDLAGFLVPLLPAVIDKVNLLN